MQERWKNEYDYLVLSGNISAAREIVRDNASGINLLKFFSGTQLQLDTIMSGKLWLSNAKNFNDPYDSLPLANVRSKQLYDKHNPQDRELAEQEYIKQFKCNQFAYDIQSSIFVTCLTECPLLTLHMWSYYADNHKGFCAEYSLEKLLYKLANSNIDIMPVVYVSKWRANRELQDLDTQVALIKGDAWSHEREWRIVRKDFPNRHEIGYKCEATYPDAIYVGCHDQKHTTENLDLRRNLAEAFNNMSVATQYVLQSDKHKVSLTEIEAKCRENAAWIPLYSMALDENNFGLRQIRINYLL